MRHSGSSHYLLDKYTFNRFNLFHESRTNFVRTGNPILLFQLPVPVMTLRGYKKWRDRAGSQQIDMATAAEHGDRQGRHYYTRKWAAGVV